MFNCDLMLQIGKDNKIYTRKATLPFAPFPGLAISLYEGADCFTVESVEWSLSCNKFRVLFEGSDDEGTPANYPGFE